MPAETAAAPAIQEDRTLPGHLDAIVRRLRPAWHDASDLPGDLIDLVVRAQILRTVHALAHDGPLAALVGRGELGLVGAHYDLDTGLVTRLRTLGF